MGRNSSCTMKQQQKLRKGLWSPEEDEKLYNYISRFGVGCWSSVPKLAGLQRCGKSCRLRWINYLRPDLKRGTFSQDEEDLIISLHEALGNKWAQIALQLPGRTDNEVKNFWNSSLKKKLVKLGIDPNTHKPISSDNEVVGPEISAISDDMGTKTEVSGEDYVPNKQVYDPMFLSEFQASVDPNEYQSDFASYYGRNHIEGNLNSGSCFNPMPGLMNFNQTEFSDSSSSRIYPFLIGNEASESSSNCSNTNRPAQIAVNHSYTFSWGSEFSGTKAEDMNTNPSPWQDGNQQFDGQDSSGEFKNYSLASLSQELSGVIPDVFPQM